MGLRMVNAPKSWMPWIHPWITTLLRLDGCRWLAVVLRDEVNGLVVPLRGQGWEEVSFPSPLAISHPRLALPPPRFLDSRGRAVLHLGGPWLCLPEVFSPRRDVTSANRADKFAAVLYLHNLIAIDRYCHQDRAKPLRIINTPLLFIPFSLF